MLVIAVMTLAIGSVHWRNGLFAATNGVEVPVLYASAFAALTLTGGVANLLIRRPVPQAAHG